MRLWCAVLLSSAWLLAQHAQGEAPVSGAALVQAHCVGCHSVQLVNSQRGNEAFWRGLIRWMQDQHNLWDIPAAQEAKIVAYLSAQDTSVLESRRPPLAPDLMPMTPLLPAEHRESVNDQDS